jgi:phenylacetic acid degradation protein
LRGDFGRLIIMAGANFQDSCIMHGFPDSDTVVEEDGHIGHGAVLHGCTVKKNAMVGMNAVVLDNAVVGESSIVAASALIKSGMQIPPRVLVTGVPGRVVRDLSEQDMAAKIQGTRAYQALARRCLASLRATEALTEVEPNRKRMHVPEITHRRH